jgi:hypothetical protein
MLVRFVDFECSAVHLLENVAERAVAYVVQ